MTKPTLVIGMHRSGTSVTAGVIHKLGVTMGEEMIPADNHNPSGYFEDKEAVGINEQILNSNGGSWLRPPQQITTYDNDDVERFIKKRNQNYNKWGFKDPRTTITYPVWASEQDFNVVFTKRDNKDIFTSLMRRQRMKPRIYKQCIQIYTDKLGALKENMNTDNYVEVEYDNLTAQPSTVVKRIADFVGQPMNEEAVGLVRL